jgi:hypothetical protein
MDSAILEAKYRLPGKELQQFLKTNVAGLTCHFVSNARRMREDAQNHSRDCQT